MFKRWKKALEGINLWLNCSCFWMFICVNSLFLTSTWLREGQEHKTLGPGDCQRSIRGSDFCWSINIRAYSSTSLPDNATPRAIHTAQLSKGRILTNPTVLHKTWIYSLNLNNSRHFCNRRNWLLQKKGESTQNIPQSWSSLRLNYTTDPRVRRTVLKEPGKRLNGSRRATIVWSTELHFNFSEITQVVWFL